MTCSCDTTCLGYSDCKLAIKPKTRVCNTCGKRKPVDKFPARRPRCHRCAYEKSIERERARGITSKKEPIELTGSAEYLTRPIICDPGMT